MKTGKNAMKSLLVLLTLLLAMSVSACGGSKDNSKSSTPSSTTEKDDKTDSDTSKEDDKTDTSTDDKDQKSESDTADNSSDLGSEAGYNADDLRNTFTEAYMGLTEDGLGVYYAGSSDGALGLLMLLDGDTSEHYVFVGPVVDNGNGFITITDEEDDIALTFSVTALDDGVELDMGDDFGTAVLGEASIEEVIDAMLQIENDTTAVTPGSDGDMSFLNDIITEAYAGAFADDMTVYIANNDDGSFMVVAFFSPDMTESISYVGSAVAEDNYITVTDDETGEKLRFAVYPEGDTMRLDMGDIGEAVVTGVEIADIITALETIDAETEAVR